MSKKTKFLSNKKRKRKKKGKFRVVGKEGGTTSTILLRGKGKGVDHKGGMYLPNRREGDRTRGG